MKKILVPISFSKASKSALHNAHHMASQFGGTLSLLHCYPQQGYSRQFDFGKLDYDKGIRKMIVDFYNQCIENDGQHKYKIITFSGPVSDIISKISFEYDLLMLSRKTGFETISNSYFGDKLFYLSTKSLCPVLITTIGQDNFSLKDISTIWHIKRKEIESSFVENKLSKIGIDPGLVQTKTFHQESFVSAFWKSIITYTKTHDISQLNDISQAYEGEQIDLIVFVNHRQGMFEVFLKNDAFQIISQFDVPILILPKQAVGQ